MKSVYALGMGGSISLAVLALLRYREPALTPAITSAMFLLFAVALAALFLTGRRHGWAPDYRTIHMLLRSRLHV
jgi:hypothetical protein